MVVLSEKVTIQEVILLNCMDVHVGEPRYEWHPQLCIQKTKYMEVQTQTIFSEFTANIWLRLTQSWNGGKSTVNLWLSLATSSVMSKVVGLCSSAAWCGVVCLVCSPWHRSEGIAHSSPHAQGQSKFNPVFSYMKMGDIIQLLMYDCWHNVSICSACRSIAQLLTQVQVFCPVSHLTKRSNCRIQPSLPSGLYVKSLNQFSYKTCPYAAWASAFSLVLLVAHPLYGQSHNYAAREVGEGDKIYSLKIDENFFNTGTRKLHPNYLLPKLQPLRQSVTVK